MADRKDILDQIEEDLKLIQATRGYNITPAEIKRGVHKWNDFTVKPAIGFTMFRDSADEESEGGEVARWMHIFFYGYAETTGLQGAGDTNAIHELAKDMEDFLFSTDNTYTNCTEVGDIEIKEGGVSDRVNAFLIEARIAYYVED